MNALIGGKKVPENLLGKLKKSSLSNTKDTNLTLKGIIYIHDENY